MVGQRFPWDQYEFGARMVLHQKNEVSTPDRSVLKI